MEHVKIKMLSGKSGSPDGVKVSFYAKDEEYEVPVSLADAFVAENVAERVDDEAAAAEPAKTADPANPDAEQKAVQKAPANKAVSKAPANKAK